MKFKTPVWIGRVIGLLSMGTMPAIGAEQIKFSYGALEFSLPVADLETYAQNGEITSQLAFYAKRFESEDVAQLRQVLTEQQNLSPLVITRLLHRLDATDRSILVALPIHPNTQNPVTAALLELPELAATASLTDCDGSKPAFAR
jgi:hypothetical protein